MTANPDNGAYVTWGRYDEAHRALVDRLDRLEAAMAHDSERRDAAALSRRNRVWLLVLGILTGVISPLVVSSVITIAHLATH